MTSQLDSRGLGFACVVGSSIAVADGVRLIVTRHQDIPGFRDIDTVSALAQMMWALGMASAFLGLLALHVTGDRAVNRWLTCVPVVGSALSAIGFVLLIAGVPTARNIPAIVGQILFMLGLLIVTIVVLVVRRWDGWRRFAPLLVLLAIPVGAMLVELTKLDGVFIAVNAAASALLGYAVGTTKPTRSLGRGQGRSTRM